MTATASRMWALEPATFQSPSQLELYGDAAPLIPFPVFVVEHPEGLALFDAGLDPDYVGDPVGAYGEMAERIRIDFREEHLIEHALAKAGFTLADVKVVVSSHLHFDHAGALKQFSHATTFIGAGEMQYAHEPERFCRAWFRREDFGPQHGIRWQVVDGDHDVFGDGAVEILHLPGHTPGSLGALVRLPENSYILTGDVVHTRGAYEGETHYHGDHDSVTARKSLRRLAQLADVHAADIWIGHDPDDWVRLGGPGEKR